MKLILHTQVRAKFVLFIYGELHKHMESDLMVLYCNLLTVKATLYLINLTLMKQ